MHTLSYMRVFHARIVFVHNIRNMEADSKNVEPILVEPAIVNMKWGSFAQRAEHKGKQNLQSLQSSHTGTTSTIEKLTTRRTRIGHNHVLIIRTDSGRCFMIISQAKCRDEATIFDLNFIGCARQYAGMCFGRGTWEHINESVD